jgi:hypothetical protein
MSGKMSADALRWGAESMLKQKQFVILGLTALVAIAAGLHIRLLDGLAGELLARTLGDTTRYAAGYTDHAFRQVRRGMAGKEVAQLIGDPLSESWVFEMSECRLVSVRNGFVTSFLVKACEEKGIKAGLAAAEAIRLLGSPPEVDWLFSESTTDSHYRQRVVELQGGRVSRIVAEFYID